MPPRGLHPLLVAAPVFLASPAGARPPTPPPPALASFIGCKSSIKEYNAFALQFASHPEWAGAWGWKELPGRGLLRVYGLRKPITVFGESATRIAFSGSGVVALLAKPPAAELARKLGLEKVMESPATALYGKTVHEKIDRDAASGLTCHEKISLSVSRSEGYQGFTLAGCSYSLDVR